MLGLAGVAALVTPDVVRVPLTLLGATALAWLGSQGVRDAVRPPVADGDGGPVAGSALRVGMILSLGNPLNTVYWAGAAGTVATLAGGRTGTAHLWVFFVGFMLSSLLWCFVCAGLISVLRRALARTTVRLLEGLCGGSLIAFAVVVLASLR